MKPDVYEQRVIDLCQRLGDVINNLPACLVGDASLMLAQIAIMKLHGRAAVKDFLANVGKFEERYHHACPACCPGMGAEA